MLALSQFVIEIPPQKNTEMAGEVTKQEGSKSLSVQCNFTEGEIFSVLFGPRSWPQGIPDIDVMVNTNITKPSSNVETEYVLLEFEPDINQWVTIPGSWNGTAIVNSTGTYTITIFSDIILLARLTVYRVHITEGKILYPYSILYYPGIAIVGLGVVLSLFGALTSKIRRVRRAKLKRKTSPIKKNNF